ncbi:2348_t:CDS:2 [Paraglomus brasilianum]|uniref:2348_t:CDS:1 n=1 Tax=Paraglomus brasilianum TaxID=144538 RepID=A0A9N9BHJ0_9GLOM|nr:2348_t:CDS:2 [Paraglomus brasilianum]
MTSSSSQLLTNCIYCSTNSYEQCSPPHRPHSPPIHGSPSSSYYQYPPFHNNISPEFHYQHYYPIPPESFLYPPSPPYSPPYYGLQQTGINQKNRNKTQIRNVYGQYDFNVGDGAGNRMIEMTNGWMGYNRESEYNAKKGGGGLGESLEGTVNALEGYEFLYETGNNAKAAIERFTLRPRSPWTQQEDRRLRELYNLLGPRWSKIATQLGTLRCGKQCEER